MQTTMTQIIVGPNNSNNNKAGKKCKEKQQRINNNKKKAEFIHHLHSRFDRIKVLVKKVRRMFLVQANVRGKIVCKIQEINNKSTFLSKQENVEYLCHEKKIILQNELIRYKNREKKSSFGLVHSFTDVGNIIKIKILKLLKPSETVWYGDSNNNSNKLYISLVDGDIESTFIYIDQYQCSDQWVPYELSGYYNISKYYENNGGMIYDTEDGRLCHAKAPFPSKIPFVDLFCGAGGFTQGIYRSKAKRKRKHDDRENNNDNDITTKMQFIPTLMVDKNNDALATASLNIGKSAKIHAVNISSKDHENQELQKLIRKAVSSNFGSGLIIDGSPCQGLSAANASRDKNDPRNLLYLAGGRLGLNGDIYIKENSPEVLAPDNNGNFFGQSLGQLFLKANYQIGFFVLSGPFYGVPQTRTRAFFVAIKSGRSFINDGVPATHQVLSNWRPAFLKMSSNFKRMCNGTKSWYTRNAALYTSLKLKPPTTVFDCLKHLVDVPLQKTDGNAHFCKDSLTAYSKNTHADNNHDNDSQNVKRKRDNILPKDFYSPTILASGPKSAGKGETGGTIWHFQFNRMPTIREASILMGFEEKFKFRTAVDSKTVGISAEFDCYWRMIGNAVIPPIAKAIGSTILFALAKDLNIEDQLTEKTMQ